MITYYFFFESGFSIELCIQKLDSPPKHSSYNLYSVSIGALKKYKTKYLLLFYLIVLKTVKESKHLNFARRLPFSARLNGHKKSPFSRRFFGGKIAILK